jgi:uncharacterized membrane protein YdjX (TVP38/TMEM64 family)
MGLYALGEGLSRRPFRPYLLVLALSGLVGLAAFVLLTTDMHFRKYLSWPLALTIAGGAAMAIAVLLVIAKARKRPQTLM